jgi:hypothetical protein
MVKKLVESISPSNGSNFAIADRGIYFMPWGSVPGGPSQPGPNSEDLAASVQFLNFSTGRTEQVAKLCLADSSATG